MSDSPPPPLKDTTTHGTPPTSPANASETTRARQGVTFGHMRWVLLISVVLAIVAMLVAYGVVL